MVGGRAHLLKKYWVPVILYAGFIFYLSALSSPVSGVSTNLSILHVPLFFVLCYLLTRAIIASSGNIGLGRAMIVAVAITTAYGVLDEFHQLFVPGRTFSYSDMELDFLGAGLIVFKDWWEKLFERVNM